MRGGGRGPLGRGAGRATAAALLSMLLAVLAVLVLAGCSTDDEVAAPTETAGPTLDGSVPREAPVPEVREREVPAPEMDDQGTVEGDGSSPVPLPAVPASREAVTGRAEALVRGALEAAEGGQLVVLVVDEHGREVVAHGADDLVLPASTLKIATAAAALVTFGPDARLTTRVEATAGIDGDGTLRGDLLLVGGGDPVLATAEYGRWVYPARPRTPLESLVEDLVAAGLERVTGDVVAITTGYEGPLLAEGWPERYLWDLDARYADGLTVDAGLRTLLSYPEPEDDGTGADTEAGEVAADGDDDDPVDPADRDPADVEEVVDLRDADRPPPDVDPIVRVDHAPEPAVHAVRELVRLLEAEGIEVGGEPRGGEVPAPVVGQLAVVASPPLGELLRFAVQRSDNQLTDGIFRAVAHTRTGTGSWEGGDRALRQVLDGLGIDHVGAAFADGSGLSRDDRATARMLVELDRRMLASRHAATWRSLMAVMGESGTLERRMAGTLAQGRFLGKTGTLRDVSGLVGSAAGADGRRYHLAVIANDPGAARWIGRSLADELIMLLVADLDDCSVREVGESPGPLGSPPLVVTC